MSDETRRRFLERAVTLGASATAVTATAGCLAFGKGAGPESSPTPTPTTDRGPGELRFGMEFSENGVRARPLEPTVQRTVLHETGDGAVDVHAAADRQYLFVQMQTGGSPGIDLPEPADFGLKFGDGEVRGSQTVGSVPPERVRPDGRAAVYDTAEERAVTEVTGWLAFPVPTDADFEAAVLALRPTEPGRPRASWNLPAATRAALAAPPASPTVTDVSVPGSVAADASVPVSVTAENGAGASGRLRFGVNVDGTAATAGRVDVPAGETETWTGQVDPGGEGTVTVGVRTAERRVTRTVEVGGDGGSDDDARVRGRLARRRTAGGNRNRPLRAF